PPISTIGFGLTSVSSARRVPRPPDRIATLISGSADQSVRRDGIADEVPPLVAVRSEKEVVVLTELANRERHLPEVIHLVVYTNAQQRGGALNRLLGSGNCFPLGSFDVHLDHRWRAPRQYLIQRRDLNLVPTGVVAHRRGGAGGSEARSFAARA